MKARRLGRKKWRNIMTDMQARIRKAKRVAGVSEREYQSRIDALANHIRSILKVIDHRGKKYPPRFPRTAS